MGAFVVVVVVVLAAPSVAAYTVINGNVTRTEMVADQSWDAYKVEVSVGQRVTVQISAAAVVDFYVLTDAQYAEYTNPAGSGFHTTNDRENVVDFTYPTGISGYIFVVDNAAISTTGAMGGAPVSYTLSVTYVSDLKAFSLYIVLAVVIAGIVGTTYWLYTPPRAFRETSKQLHAVLK